MLAPGDRRAPCADLTARSRVSKGVTHSILMVELESLQGQSETQRRALLSTEHEAQHMAMAPLSLRLSASQRFEGTS